MVMEEERQPCGKKQDQDDRALELGKQEGKRVGSLLRCEKVRAVLGQPPPGFGTGQSLRRAFEPMEHLSGRETPKRFWCLVHAALSFRMHGRLAADSRSFNMFLS